MRECEGMINAGFSVTTDEASEHQPKGGRRDYEEI
jgi:hypothetical protein